MATHTGIDLYQCQFCTRTFKSHANMHNHKKKMHPNDWVRKYSQPSSSITSTAAPLAHPNHPNQPAPPAAAPTNLAGHMLPPLGGIAKSLIEIPDTEGFDFGSNSSVCPTTD